MLFFIVRPGYDGAILIIMISSENILELIAVKKEFVTSNGPLVILDHVNVTIRRGEKVAIVGPSGSGKSTLLSLIGLLDMPTSGTIKIGGSAVDSLSEKAQAKFRNERIGFIFQSFELIEPFTVMENIIAPFDIGGNVVPQAQMVALAERLGIVERLFVLPHTLSGGEKQRVAIGRALAHRPDIILADEPTGSLDRATGERVLSLLLETVTEAGSTLIIITHDEGIATKMDRVFELKDKTLHERL